MAELPISIIERLRAGEKLSDHLEPDLISAWFENSLKPADRNRVLQHLACCSQCREISALSLPERLDAAPRSTASTWLGWPVLRWGVVAACLLLVSVVTLRHRSRPLQPTGSETATAEPQTPAPLPAPAAAASSPRPFAEKSPAPVHQGRVSALPAVSQERKAGSGVGGEAMIAAADLPTPPSTGLEEAVPGRAKEVRQVPGSSELPQAVGAPALATTKTSATAFANAATPGKLVPRWTLSSDGTLERSFDAGNTWETVPLPTPARFYVLSAHGMDIWLGGSAGALYHSSDAGWHWIHVQPVANGQALTQDVIGMEFIDDDHGVLTTSTNQQWATEDCGQSWQRK